MRIEKLFSQQLSNRLNYQTKFVIAEGVEYKKTEEDIRWSSPV